MSARRGARARTSGGELAYTDVGQGPAVVLLHGFPTWSYLWRRFVPALAPEMRAVAVDLLGYGESDKPDGVRLDARAQAEYVGELLDRLGVEEFAVVGHDLGGAVAQLLCLDGRRVRAMVLLDAAGLDGWPHPALRRLQGMPPELATEDRAREAVDLALEGGMGHSERLTHEMREAYRTPFAGVEGTRAFFRAVHAIDGVGLAGREPELELIEAPVLILWGEDDRNYPVELAERLSEAMPSSSLALLPGCSHLLPEDSPETVVPLVFEYLRSRYLERPHGHSASGGPVMLGLDGLRGRRVTEPP